MYYSIHTERESERGGERERDHTVQAYPYRVVLLVSQNIEADIVYSRGRALTCFLCWCLACVCTWDFGCLFLYIKFDMFPAFVIPQTGFCFVLAPQGSAGVGGVASSRVDGGSLCASGIPQIGFCFVLAVGLLIIGFIMSVGIYLIHAV